MPVKQLLSCILAIGDKRFVAFNQVFAFIGYFGTSAVFSALLARYNAIKLRAVLFRFFPKLLFKC